MAVLQDWSKSTLSGRMIGLAFLLVLAGRVSGVFAPSSDAEARMKTEAPNAAPCQVSRGDAPTQRS